MIEYYHLSCPLLCIESIKFCKYVPVLRKSVNILPTDTSFGDRN